MQADHVLPEVEQRIGMQQAEEEEEQLRQQKQKKHQYEHEQHSMLAQAQHRQNEVSVRGQSHPLRQQIFPSQELKMTAEKHETAMSVSNKPSNAALYDQQVVLDSRHNLNNSSGICGQSGVSKGPDTSLLSPSKSSESASTSAGIARTKFTQEQERASAASVKRLRQLEFGQWRKGLLISLARTATPKSPNEKSNTRFKRRVQNARWRLWVIDQQENQRRVNLLSDRREARAVVTHAGLSAPRIHSGTINSLDQEKNLKSSSEDDAGLASLSLCVNRQEAAEQDDDAETGPNSDWESSASRGQLTINHSELESGDLQGQVIWDSSSIDQSGQGLMRTITLGSNFASPTLPISSLKKSTTYYSSEAGKTPSAPLVSGSGFIFDLEPSMDSDIETDEEPLSSSASDSSLSAGETASLAAAVPQPRLHISADDMTAQQTFEGDRLHLRIPGRPMALRATGSSLSGASLGSYEIPGRPKPWHALRRVKDTVVGPDPKWLAPAALLVGDAAHQRAVRKLLENSPHVLKGHFRARLAGRGNSMWHKRFYVLTENFLFEYESRKDPAPIGCIGLSEVVTSVTTAGSLLISFQEALESSPSADRARLVNSLVTRSPEKMAAGVESMRWHQLRSSVQSMDEGVRVPIPSRTPPLLAGGGPLRTGSALSRVSHRSRTPTMVTSNSGGDLFSMDQGGAAKSSPGVVVELQPMGHQDVQIWRNQIAHNSALRIADLYQINVDERLGVGRYAEVHECTRAADGRRSAVKVVNKSDYYELIAMGKERPRALAREISTQTYLTERMVSTGRDLGCVPILRVFETPSLLVIEMELMDRCNLHELLRTSKDRKFSESRAADVAIALVRILEQLDYYRVAHRDVKLSNVTLIRGRGERFHFLSPFELRSGLRLIDFGMATYIDPQGMLTGRCGTPGYVAPEILACKQGARYTSNVDMFSVGVIVYTLLCGREPFQRGNTQDTLRANRKCEVDLEGMDLSGQAKHFLINVLEANPHKRLTPSHALEHPWLRAQPRPPPRVARAPSAKSPILQSRSSLSSSPPSPMPAILLQEASDGVDELKHRGRAGKTRSDSHTSECNAM